MKFLSSIFSFDTLKISTKPFQFMLATILIVVGLNLFAEYGKSKGILYTSIPTHMVQNQVEQTRSPFDYWFVGNSTLADSLDIPTISQQHDIDIHPMIMGSSTFEAMTRLALHCLQNDAAPPQSIYFFITKDDFNHHGDRSAASRSYYQAIDSPPFSERILMHLPLYAYRISIKKRTRAKLIDIMKTIKQFKHRENASQETASPYLSASSNVPQYRDISNDFHITYLANLGRNYELSLNGFNYLQEIRKNWPHIKIVLIHPPVTKAVANWQNHYVPTAPHQQIVETIESNSSHLSAEFQNFSDYFPSTTQYFKDAYHLNARTKSEFTSYFSKTLLSATD